jgi:hypothetical protein
MTATENVGLLANTRRAASAGRQVSPLTSTVVLLEEALDLRSSFVARYRVTLLEQTASASSRPKFILGQLFLGAVPSTGPVAGLGVEPPLSGSLAGSLGAATPGAVGSEPGTGAPLGGVGAPVVCGLYVGVGSAVGTAPLVGLCTLGVLMVASKCRGPTGLRAPPVNMLQKDNIKYIAEVSPDKYA